MTDTLTIARVAKAFGVPQQLLSSREQRRLDRSRARARTRSQTATESRKRRTARHR